MAVFRIQEHVPDVYPRKSRDFQLLCNVFDCMNSAVKYDIDSIRDVTDTNLCNDRVLNFLQTKLGFFTNKHMNTDTQRLILKAFPYIIKNKGSTKGIKQAIYVFLKTQGVNGNVSVDIINNKEVVNNLTPNTNKLEHTYVVELGIQTKLLDTTILNEILKYIIPAGYIVKYSFYVQHQMPTIIKSDDTINIIFVRDSLNSGIRLSNSDESLGVLPVNAISTVSVPSNDTQDTDSVVFGSIQQVKDSSDTNIYSSNKEE